MIYIYIYVYIIYIIANTTVLFIRKSLFIVSLSLGTDILNYIDTELQTHYKNIKTNKQKQWKEGDLCIAQYHNDKKWYRGRIVKHSGNLVHVRNNN